MALPATGGSSLWATTSPTSSFTVLLIAKCGPEDGLGGTGRSWQTAPVLKELLRGESFREPTGDDQLLILLAATGVATTCTVVTVEIDRARQL